MDTEMNLSPMPVQSVPASPSLGPRKRSIHEVDGAGNPSPSSKRSFPDASNENQENRDPSLPLHPKEPPSPSSRQSFVVEVPAMNINQNHVSTVAPTAGASVQSDPIQQAGSGSPTKSDTTTAPATKKRKLSPTSQQAKQQEKERQKAEEKHKKEEDKRLKEEEKKKRDAAKEEEKRLKEEEKKKREAEREEEKKQREEKKKAKEEEKAAKEAAKEEEKRRKEEEKQKKEKAQPKLNSFFAKPRLPSAVTGAAPASPKKTAPSVIETTAEVPTSTKSDYQRVFPDFFLQSHTIVAPPHRFERDSEALQHVRQKLDGYMASHSATIQPIPFKPSEVFNIIPFSRRRGRNNRPVKEILQKIQRASDESLQPGAKQDPAPVQNLHKLLRTITVKSLRFGEDVRPPYQGTWTRTVPEPSVKKLCRNPYHRGLPDINYDYDSEAEWEEPEEGEDLNSEDEDEMSDDGEDDMDEFLDDEDDALAGGKRRLIVGDLEPVNSGIRWAADGIDPDLKMYQIETISDAVKFPIDPFSTAYWEKPRAEPVTAKGRAAVTGLEAFGVKPKSTAPAVSTALPPPPTTSKARKPFPPESLNDFKQAVDGSDLSKIGLVEILKKKFPKVSKETLKATLDQVAVRIGQKEVDKKWVCR
ncbi:hypothetical protein N7448_000534 [Penicillium atrosanguineum]|uniref:Chromatin assembly factor 1 subunit A n=1 Tax=Penicillium atrosanguineum TaxID=1132637 RepID=A0A9W9HKQ1_9EURO|nr:uncharacterized protein N7443_003932 [Penicillium atrosanguineum]KAJ5148956.1 hypothetical protein N7448_000534 [Penicillium atrosanguineum]KAJ5304272.1 hypothetical protein N7443_003932 [Penicillium atrosanguineum]KAJ5323747.1 hypothetical protein N7476_002347 [Penicillium atrosanguineum]